MTGGQQEPGRDTQPAAGDQLKDGLQDLVDSLGDLALTVTRDKLTGLTERLTDYVEQSGNGNPGLMAALTGAKSMAEGKGPVRSLMSAGMSGLKDKITGGGKDGQRRNLKVTNIVESIDVGVPVRVAYNQWTQFRDFPSFMKKVENVGQEEDAKLHWKAQVFWSHREWDANIIKQVPDQCIVWRSKGPKGHVDGSVTFHQLAPEMTRILLVLEYHPQGLFERTGNLWRAQGRRARLEIKHFRRHVMTQAILHPDEVEGWRGVIEDGKVVQDHESRLREEQQRDEAGGEDRDEEAYQNEEGYPDEEGDREPDAEDYEEGYEEDEEPGEEDEGYPEDEADEAEPADEDDLAGEDEDEDGAEPAAAAPAGRRRSR